MADEQVTIASAVVLPESEELFPKMPSVKRRHSSISESDSKRPRLSTEASEDRDEKPVSPVADRLTDRRKSGQLEERKRGQRLFGALLGTLSQSSSSAAQRRRADIEKKQQAKLKLQAEEYDEKKKKELDELLAVRKQEQKKFDEQSMRTRHNNLIAMAHFLYTKAEPRLYYKPWELSPEQAAQIKSQILDAEATVERELQDFHGRMSGMMQGRAPSISPIDTNDSHVHPPSDLDHPSSKELVGSESNPATASSPKRPVTNENTHPQTKDMPNDTMESETVHGGDDAEGGEMNVDAEEDRVIY